METQPIVPTPIPVQAPTPVSTRIDGPVELSMFAWKLFMNNWQSFVAIAAVPSILGYAGSMLATSKSIEIVIASIVVIVIGIIFSIASLPATVDAVHKLTVSPGARISMKDQYRLGFRYFWSLIYIGLLSVLISVGATIFFIIPVFIIAVYNGLYTYVLVLENKKGLSVFLGSYSLIRGHWFAVVGRILFLVLILILVQLAIGGVIALLKATGTSVQSLDMLTGLINLIVNIMLMPITVAYSYRLYSTLKSTSTSEVSTKLFKRFITGFMILGILSIVAIGITVPALIVSSVNEARQSIESTQSNP